MSIKVMTRVWEHAQHKGSALLLLLALADHANDEGICWPSIETLAAKIRMSERQTQRMLGTLIASGDVYAYEGRGRGHTSRYAVLTGLDDRAITAILGRYFTLTPDEVTAYLVSIRTVPSTRHKGVTLPPLSCSNGDKMTAFRDEKAAILSTFSDRKDDNLTPFPDQKGVTFARKGDIPGQKGDRALTPEPLMEPLHEPSGNGAVGVDGVGNRDDTGGGTPAAPAMGRTVRALVSLGLTAKQARATLIRLPAFSEGDLQACRAFLATCTAVKPAAVLWSNYLAEGAIPPLIDTPDPYRYHLREACPHGVIGYCPYCRGELDDPCDQAPMPAPLTDLQLNTERDPPAKYHAVTAHLGQLPASEEGSE